MKQRILVIDDEKDLCALIMRILSEADYETHCANSLQDGKQKWDELDPAIVILDNNLPDGTGLDLLEENAYLLKKSLVIFITADVQEETETRANQLGVAVFMNKPFSITEIRNVVVAQQHRA